MNKTAIIIPSHLSAKRLPNKPMLKINNKTMISHVWERSVASNVNDVFVATADEEILNEIKKNGGNAILTGKHHTTGSDRIYEAIEKLQLDHEIIINVQGDMPDITEDIILAIKQGLDEGHKVVTAYTEMAPELRTDPNSVKMIHNGTHAHWFCRASLKYGDHHLGVYGYNWRTLVSYKSMPQSQEEKIEKLEQLRFLQNGVSINIRKVDFDGIEINTPEDLEKWLTKN